MGAVIRRHGFSVHMYADDTQIYASFDPSQTQHIVSKLNACLEDVYSWMAHNWLKMNGDKTQAIVIGSKHLRAKMPPFTLVVAGSSILPSQSVCNLGTTFDSEMSMDGQVNSVVQKSMGQIRRIGSIRQFLTTSSTQLLVQAFVSSRLDFSNSLLGGLSGLHLSKLQKVQNTSARLVTKTKRIEHITPVLNSLHWLPVKYRIEYKILLLTFKALIGDGPFYLKELLHQCVSEITTGHSVQS